MACYNSLCWEVLLTWFQMLFLEVLQNIQQSFIYIDVYGWSATVLYNGGMPEQA